MNSSNDRFEVLRDLFGDYRAEWPPERFRELFIVPAYFKRLEARRPSFLMGGRGTGKTTALKSLRFDATLQRLQLSGAGFDEQEHLGIFVRMNKNRVRAFQGGGIERDRWRKSFAHYFNLLACAELSELAIWLENQTSNVLPPNALADVSRDLAIPVASNLPDFVSRVRIAISELQIFVNNPTAGPPPVFSMAEVPLKTFAEAINKIADNRTIFCCIDEYENLLDEHQAVLNTYIKHAEEPLSYKVGVRVNGLRNRNTLEGSDELRTPDDYEQIQIASEGFELFATAVAERRLARAIDRGASVPSKLESFLEELSLAEEAAILGAGDVAAGVMRQLEQSPALHQYFSALPNEQVYFLQYWAETEKSSISEMASDWVKREEQWRDRINNYAFSSLYWLSRGKKGRRIKKFYSGLRTFLALSCGNIRYFLELIDTAIGLQLDEIVDRRIDRLTVAPKVQTIAAKTVGQRRLEELEGLADHGVELKRLVLAIGKVFFELARNPIGRTPEVTSFTLTGEHAAFNDVTKILKEGAAHLALEATPRTKATTQFEMRDDEYRLHPIFCAFFEISHRRKRRTTFNAADLLLVLEKPSQGISNLLGGDPQTTGTELPEQLALFAPFFQGGDGLEDSV